MIKVGLTGGIGSGKSTVCSLFKKLGVPTFDADYAAKVAKNTPQVSQYLANKYGDTILTNGEYDNKKLSQIVFNDKQKLNELTDMVSIHIIRDYELFCINNEDKPYTIFESAILFERGLNYLFDVIVSVIADEETRINRVMKRNNFTREEVTERINNQLSNAEILRLSDYFIMNNDDVDISGETFNNEQLNNEIIRIDKQLKCL